LRSHVPALKLPASTSAFLGLTREPGQPSSWRTLRNRSFRDYFCGSVVSDFGTWLQTSFYPWEFITGGATDLLMAQDISAGAVRYLSEKIRVRQIGYRDWITVRLPDDNEQKFFGIGHDATVFAIFRIAFDQDKRPMRLTVTVFPTDRNQFIVDVGDDLPDPQYDHEWSHVTA
jgi:hypothetical protein